MILRVFKAHKLLILLYMRITKMPHLDFFDSPSSRLKQKTYCVNCVYPLSKITLIFLDSILIRNGFK
jgi:hypothetical protein